MRRKQRTSNIVCNVDSESWHLAFMRALNVTARFAWIAAVSMLRHTKQNITALLVELPLPPNATNAASPTAKIALLSMNGYIKPQPRIAAQGATNSERKILVKANLSICVRFATNTTAKRVQ